MFATRLAVVVTTLLLAGRAFAHGEEHKPAPATEHRHSPAAETSFGRAADPRKATRTVMVEMRDSNEFVPSEITVAQGEIVRFVAVNVGIEMHEMVLGTLPDLKAHAEMMKKPSGMQHGGEPNIAHVAPGNSGVIAWQFTQPGEFYFACLVDNHFEKGMMGRIRVAAAPGAEHHGHEEHAMPMQGAFGPYAMAREASGTSWAPEAARHPGFHSMHGEWSLMTHGFLNLIHDDQGGPRGDRKTFSTSMFMLMAQRPAAGGTLGLRGMVSGDALMGKTGYPLLLQTGESANGQPLIDRQHPHDLFMELSASYSRPLSERSSVFVYAGLPGEPALGPPAFMHRFSGEDNPEAPISHHWLDSTHITFGVVTVGLVLDRFKLEGSVFRGREPDEHRYDIETGKLDSASARLSYNPTDNWALQVSRGRIKSPEALHPDMDVDRTTASVIYHRAVGAADTQTTLAWGRNAPNHGETTSAWLLESAARFSRSHTFFARLERADKNELFLDPDPRAEEKFRVGKLTVGYVYDLPREGHARIGFGGLVSGYSIPGDLEPVYGSPTSFMLFARVKLI
jgi:uncharacterized cupredoxin-like copper-binding protein